MWWDLCGDLPSVVFSVFLVPTERGHKSPNDTHRHMVPADVLQEDVCHVRGTWSARAKSVSPSAISFGRQCIPHTHKRKYHGTLTYVPLILVESLISRKA